MLSLSEIKKMFQKELEAVENSKQLQELQVRFTGKKGFLSQAIQSLPSLPPEDRKIFGAEINSFRNSLSTALSQKESVFEEAMFDQRLKQESLDITLPGRHFKRGKIHPLTQVLNEVKAIFTNMGFVHIEDTEIEDDWHNFTALNISENHPARQMHDTFYLKDVEKLLRTHTSSVQIRHMEKYQPPIRIISAGRVYRSDYDATHTPMFHQLEGLWIAKDINICHMKSCVTYFLKKFFNVKNLQMRLRPSYFPFTEPSVEVDIKCDRSNKEEIKIGHGDDWLEILGCGMVNEKVLLNVNIDPNEYQGFAFGVGLERLAMLKYNIPDLRFFFEGDIRWLEHYGF